MIMLAIVATVVAGVWSMVVGGANAMTDNVTDGFKGGPSLFVVWGLVAVLWLAWGFS